MTGLSPAWVALIGATILTVVVETKDVHAVMKVILKAGYCGGQIACGG